MIKLRYGLSILFASQLFLAAGIFWFHQKENQDFPQALLLIIDQANIDRVIFSNSENKETVTMDLVKGNWQLPEMKNLPADSPSANS